MGVLENFYAGSDPVSDPSVDNPHAYTHYVFDITSLVKSGGPFQLRFAEVNNQDNLFQGVDNVSVHETPAVPEASTLASLGLLLVMGRVAFSGSAAEAQKTAANRKAGGQLASGFPNAVQAACDDSYCFQQARDSVASSSYHS